MGLGLKVAEKKFYNIDTRSSILFSATHDIAQLIPDIVDADAIRVILQARLFPLCEHFILVL
jgi:hypothetical protein